MEEVERTLVSVDLDQTGLELLPVIVVLTMLACSVSLACEQESIALLPGEREYSEHSLVRSRQFDLVLSAQFYTYICRQMRLHLRLLLHIEHLSMKFMDLCPIGRLLRVLLLPIEVSGCLAVHQPDVEALVSYSRTH